MILCFLYFLVLEKLGYCGWWSGVRWWIYVVGGGRGDGGGGGGCW